MALRVWLPLNGNANNQGLLDNFTQSVTPSYTTDGKIGKAMTTGAFVMSAEQAASVLNNESVSFCFWTYIDADTGTTNNRSMFFGTDSMGTNNNRKFSIFNYPTVNDLHLSWMNDTANTAFISCIMSGVLPSRKWTHVAVTYNNPTCIVYINGVAKYTFTGISNSSSFAYQTQLIHNASYRRLNDFRIYNHCLSPKEVKEISKGLCLHYPLNNIYNCQPNKYSSPYCDGYMSNTGGFTRTALTNERGYNYKMTYTGTGNNAWKSLCVPNYSFTVGKNYYYSVKIRCNKWTGDSLYLRASRSNNDWVTRSVQVCSSGQADGQWHEYYTYQTVNETYDRSGSTVTCNPVLEFYTGGCATNGFIYDFDFDIKDVQVIESDQYVPFQEGQWNTNIVSDCSGFRNDGIKSGTLLSVSNSPRYNRCHYFDKSGIYKDNLNLTLSNFTMTYWVKRDSTTGINKMFLGSNSSTAVNSSWYHYGDNSFKFPLGEYYYNHNAGTENALLNTWVFFAFVYNGTKLQVYRNGIDEGSKDFSGSVTLNNLSVGIGYDNSSYWSHAYISDFRLYTTALSNADILELYEAGGAIDSHYNSYVYEYITDDSNEYLNSQGISGISDLEETDENTKWLSTGKIESNNFYEI